MQDDEIAVLNERHALDSELRFAAGPGGLPEARVANASASAAVSLWGGQVLSYRPSGAEPVIWMSAKRYVEAGRAIRGGVPVCWPWFGRDPDHPERPQHGFARTARWEVVRTGRDGADTRIVLALPPSPAIAEHWPHPFELELTAVVGATLSVSLATRNPGPEPFALTEALHTYIAVGDVHRVRLAGLDGRTYVDTVGGARERRRQDGDVTFTEETDRIYVGTEGSCVLHDPVLGRAVRVEKAGSRSTVVWNPWSEKARAMADFGDDEYLEMVCVETANAADDALRLEPGAEHVVTTTISLA